MKTLAGLLCATILSQSFACKKLNSTRTQSDNAGSDAWQAVTAKKPSEQAFRMESREADSCKGGYEFQFTAFTSTHAKKLEFSVHQLATSAYPDPASNEIEAKIPKDSGRRLIGVINAGFFNEDNGEPYSYFQSAPPWLPPAQWKKLANKGTLPRPSKAGSTLARPCLEWLGPSYLPRFFLPKRPEDWKERDANPTSNIMCAGPLLFENATKNNNSLSLQRQLEENAKLGGFSKESRADGADPLSIDKKQARTASCIKQNGDFLIFAKFPDSCGLSLADLQKKLFELGCKTALSHDGGTSVQYTFYGQANYNEKQSTTGKHVNMSRHRKVPVWLAVSLLK